MTNEQREAIDRLKDDIKHAELRDAVNDDCTVCFTEDVDTILSLIKEQQKEIESLQKEVNEENNRCMILANNDKFKEQVIDLMAEHIHINNCYKCPNIKCEDNGGITCEDCIKQYFANKVNSKIQ